MSDITFPLSPIERNVRTHAILSTVGFLILLPIGVLVARYSRTLPYKWFPVHWIIQLIISAPVILYGWVQGHKATSTFGAGHIKDAHEKVGLVLLALYVLQIVIGAAVHFAKLPNVFKGRRPPHAYFHIFLGLVIFACAQWQVYHALYYEWTFATGGLHQIPISAKHAWLALTIVFWALYALGMAFIPKQLKQEGAIRNPPKAESTSSNNDQA